MTESLNAWEAFTSSTPSGETADNRWRAWNAIHRIQAQYEAALPRDDLWTLADFKDADASLVPEVRKRIRSRARYEYANNPLVARVIDVWVSDVCGENGPWLQLHSGNIMVDRLIETAWVRWWRAANQAGKLRTAVKADAVDGETLGALISNRHLLRTQPVSLDVVGVECDRLASAGFENANHSDYIDGVHLDPYTREALAYDLLKAHPGTEYLDTVPNTFDYETFPREQILHAFRRLRPEQNRGVCRYAPVLPLSGLHRKYLEAEVSRNTLRAAFAFVIKSMAPPDDGESGDVGTGTDTEWWQQISLPNRQGAGLFLPDGYDVSQFRPDGSANELGTFHQILGGVVAGCFTMPVGRALGQYQSSGYAGMRGELLPYHRTIASDRLQVWEPGWLCPLYYAFLEELLRTSWFASALEDAGLTPDFQRRERFYGVMSTVTLPAGLDLYNVEFQWPERELVVDPNREENSRKTKLAMGLTTREREIDVADIDAHDERAAALLGLDSVREYRRLVAQSIHGVPVAGAGREPRAESPEQSPGSDHK